MQTLRTDVEYISSWSSDTVPRHADESGERPDPLPLDCRFALIGHGIRVAALRERIEQVLALAPVAMRLWLFLRHLAKKKGEGGGGDGGGL